MNSLKNRLTSLLALLSLSPMAQGQVEFERPPIDYHNRETSNPIEDIRAKVSSGEVKLRFDETHGYLVHLLELLGIDTSSQVLVFSKTSLQLKRIKPERPRAIYFDDVNYIGYCQFGDVVEIATTDPKLGAIFYTLAQEPVEKPDIIRDRGECMQCHGSNRTKGVPGHLIRSVYSNKYGQPEFGRGTYTTDHSTPFDQRFGGWYVSGTHGKMRHMGNVSLESPKSLDLDREAGANVTDLSMLVDVAPYLEPTSDIVALMALQHQSQMHNYLTLANLETLSALYYNDVMAKAFDREDGYLSGSTKRRIRSVAEKLVKYMLFSEEFALEAPVAGTSDFAKNFSARGPKDASGRSLFQLDLETRFLKYPCSWLVYTDSFDSLPEITYDAVATELYFALRGQDERGDFVHLSSRQKQDIYEILYSTKPGLAKIWEGLGTDA